MSITAKNLGMSWMLSLLVAGAGTAADLRLVDAAKSGDQETVRSLLKQHVDVNAPEGDGATALSWAAFRDELETAGLLITAGANANAANDYGAAPLMLACANGSAAEAPGCGAGAGGARSECKRSHEERFHSLPVCRPTGRSGIRPDAAGQGSRRQ